MAHFAEIDTNNVVVRVLVVPNDQEHRGQEFLANDLGLGGTWIQTSYNHRIRGKYAAVGDIYNVDLDRFEPVKPHPSMIWSDEYYTWLAPTPKPGPGWTFDTNSGEWTQTPTE